MLYKLIADVVDFIKDAVAGICAIILGLVGIGVCIALLFSVMYIIQLLFQCLTSGGAL